MQYTIIEEMYNFSRILEEKSSDVGLLHFIYVSFGGDGTIFSPICFHYLQ